MKYHRGFAAFLSLLLVLAIAMMLYCLDLKAIFGPSLAHVSHPMPLEDHPWKLEDLLLTPDKIVPSPHKGQPELLEPVTLTGQVERNTLPRGTIQLDFSKDCRIQAIWQCQYTQDHKNYTIQSELHGNAVPSRYYSDDQGEDRTRLFFIAKGTYRQTIVQPAQNVQTEQGTAYLLCWLHPGNTVNGSITITTDKSWSARYSLKAGKPESRSP